MGRVGAAAPASGVAGDHTVVVQAPAGPPGTALGDALAAPRQVPGSFPALVGPLERWVVTAGWEAGTPPAEPTGAVGAGTGDAGGDALERLALSGEGDAEAAAVRARRAGAALVWGPGVPVDGEGLLAWCLAAGRDAVRVARDEPELVCELRVGAWFEAAWRARALRRLGVAAVGGSPSAWRAVAAALDALPAGLPGGALAWRTAADAAFWAGVRAACTPEEWARWTAGSYVALSYHRLAGEGRPGQEQLDVDPERFAAGLALLARLGWKALSPAELVAFHRTGATGTVPRRRLVVTSDDGYVDNAAPLAGAAGLGWRPQLFVPTADVGAPARWLDGEPTLGWDGLRRLADGGVVIGSHAHRHDPLAGRPPAELRAELDAAVADLDAHLGDTPAGGGAPWLLAYPNGRHDAAVRDAARAAGHPLAYTTEVGRNGAGTDPWCLRRIAIHDRDSLPAVVWKALTGELLPPRWEARRLRVDARRQAARVANEAHRPSTAVARSPHASDDQAFVDVRSAEDE